MLGSAVSQHISDNSAVSRSVITAPLLIQPAAYTYIASLHVAEYHRATQIASARFYLQCTTLTSRGCESGQEALNCQLPALKLAHGLLLVAKPVDWLQSGLSCELGRKIHTTL